MRVHCVPVMFTTFFGGLATGVTAMAVDAYGGPSLQEIFHVGDSPLGSLVVGFGFGAATILVLAGLAKCMERCALAQVEPVESVKPTVLVL